MNGIDFSKPIPQEYWQACKNQGTLVNDSFGGKNLCIYIPFGYDAGKPYDIFYFKMGTNNTASQFWFWKGYNPHFNYVIDNLIDRCIIKPCIIVSIDGNKAGKDWLSDNAYSLLCYVEGKYTTYAYKDAARIIDSAPHRAIGGWSLGAIECRNILVNEKRNDYWKSYGFFDLQSCYNAKQMETISPIPVVACVAGSKDDPSCVAFTNACKNIFSTNAPLRKNHAQIVNGYTHAINYQIAYFYNAIQALCG